MSLALPDVDRMRMIYAADVVDSASIILEQSMTANRLGLVKFVTVSNSTKSYTLNAEIKF